jgi:hypothetical protein
MATLGSSLYYSVKKVEFQVQNLEDWLPGQQDEPLWCGWGACSKCACAGFVEDFNNRNVCSRCGHSYSEHW